MNDSQKTTVLGILGIISVVAAFLVALLDGNPATVPDLPKLLETIGLGSVGAGLIFARGNKVSDEQAGAGKK